MNVSSSDDQAGFAEPGGWLRSHIEEVVRTRRGLVAKERSWSWARLITFLAAVGIWYPLMDRAVVAIGAVCAMLVGFRFCVRRHLLARARRELADRLYVVTTESLRRVGGQIDLIRGWERPAGSTDPDCALRPILDDGPTWTLTDQERGDLDLFAEPVGLFGLLNRTSTIIGSRRLADMLDHPCLDPEHIRRRQGAVQWLERHAPERFRIMASMAGLREKDRQLGRFVSAIRRAEPWRHPTLVHLARVWSIFSGVFTVVALALTGSGQLGWGAAFLGLLLLNTVLYRQMHSRISPALHAFGRLAPVAGGCLDASRQAVSDLPGGTELKKLKACFARVVFEPVLPSLCRRLEWTEAGGMLHALANALLFYDLHALHGVLSRVIPHRDELLRGLSALADLEALLSLGSFAWEQPHKCYPEPVDAPGLLILGGVHPLISPQRAVPNDVKLVDGQRVWIVTGSNMAGKSTLLRMAAVNALLAQLGTAVTAREMSFSPVRLMTDLRASDNLSEDESYFLAEVRQLRRMVLPPPGSAPVLGLIDEPFRGTNSQEQIAGSLAVVQHLIRSGHFFLAATHERLLTDLADGTLAANFHFREDLDSNGLVFDYRLRPGPARTRNALRVLEREGYPDEVLDEAHAWFDDPTRQGGGI